MTRTTFTAGLTLIALGLLAPLGGCRDSRTDNPPRQFFPDMDEQRRWDPQEATDFYADRRTARVPVDNAVPFAPFSFNPAVHGDEPWAAGMMVERSGMLADDDAVYRGVEITPDGAEVFIDYIPVTVTRDMLEHGRQMFDIYCAVCHGYEGAGQGMVGRVWAYPPANLNSEVYRDRANRQGKDGYIFEVILNGLVGPDGANRMPGYARALDPMDAWAVVAYLRALQRANATPWDQLSPDDRQRLGAPRPAAPAPEGDQPAAGEEGAS